MRQLTRVTTSMRDLDQLKCIQASRRGTGAPPPHGRQTAVLPERLNENKDRLGPDISIYLAKGWISESSRRAPPKPVSKLMKLARASNHSTLRKPKRERRL
jgi:hypothetical protein